MTGTRYDNLGRALETIYRQGVNVLRFMEIGTYDGNRAVSLLKWWTARDKKNSAEYYGFDLFEDLTPEKSKAELSKSKLPPAIEVVQAKFAMPRVRAQLMKGETCQTLQAKRLSKLPMMNLIYIDGGHSLETIHNDWTASIQLAEADTIILFDDYYENRTDFGCKTLVDQLIANGGYNVELLDPLDEVPANNLKIRMVKVTFH
jgi:hypothetical protein